MSSHDRDSINAVDWIIKAGAIYSMAADRKVYRALAIRNEWIVAVSEEPDGLDNLITSGTRQIGVQGPEYAIDRYTAFQLYTFGSAQFYWEDHRLGTLQSQRLADFIAYRADPITCPTEDLLKLRPVLTVVAGQAVYDPEMLTA